MTPTLTIFCSGTRFDSPEYDWKNLAAPPPVFRIEPERQGDCLCLFLPLRKMEYGVCFSSFRCGSRSRYILRSGAEHFGKLCITVTTVFRKFVRKVRNVFSAVLPAVCPAARERRGRAVLRL